MNNIFQKTSAFWARYSEYEYRRGEDGQLYITPTQSAKPSVYDPLVNAKAMAVDALNVGRLSMKLAGEKKLQDAVMDFVTKYGLLGFMTALPTTADFIDYDAVYLPKNHYIKEETMSTQEYLAIYFPFGKPDFYKDAHTAQWNMSGNAQRDREMLALSMAFGGKAPTYHISLYRDKPMIVWDFHSLLRGIQMMFSFALTDEARPLRLCKKCTMAFVAERPDDEFCGCE